MGKIPKTANIEIDPNYVYVRKPVVKRKVIKKTPIDKIFIKSEKRSKLLFEKYGITSTDYNIMLSEQNGQCYICGSTYRLCVDHDHKTGAVRGILCYSCNYGLGYFKDNPISLLMASKYILKSIIK